jgi:V8-like Glu-specific endopeptidase
MMVDTVAGRLYAAPPSTAEATVHTSALGLQPPSEGLQPAGPASGTVPDAALQEQELLASMLWGSDEPGVLQQARNSASRGRHARVRISTGRRMAAAAAAALAGGRRRLQGVFGQDTRKEVRVLPKYPLSATGHLLFSNPIDTARYQCSGTLVGTWTVLTAAHCVVARSGQVQNNITFTAGQTLANSTGLGTAKGVRVIFNSEYLSSAKEWVGWDLGIIVLDKPLGVASAEAYVQELRRLKQQAALQAKRFSSSNSSSTSSSSSNSSSSNTSSSSNSSRVISRSLQPAAGTTKSPLPAAVQQQAWAPGNVGFAAAPTLQDTLLISTGECGVWVLHFGGGGGARACLQRLPLSPLQTHRRSCTAHTAVSTATIQANLVTNRSAARGRCGAD